MIVSGPNGFEKGEYRKYNIKSAELTPGDDYAMMREVLTRRFSRLVKENEADEAKAKWPNLVLIDGGPGQLAIACQVFADLGVEDVTVVGISKGPDRDAGREHFYMPGREPFRLDPKSPVLYFLQRLRDEAHRFAIGSHRKKRSKAIGANPLDEVAGVGASRKRALLQHFGSARAVSAASLSDLETVSGISGALAKKIYDFFHANG
jgi:excinuclease ABC subunit C